MKSLGFYEAEDGNIYELIYFPDEGLGQAIGPIPEHVGTARVAEEVHANSELEARVLLIAELKGTEIEDKGPTLLTTTTNTTGATRATSTTLPQGLINADPELVSKDASKLIVQDNPELKPIEQILAQHVSPLLSGISSQEKLDTEAVQKTDKVEITINYTKNYYKNVGRDAYFAEHVGSMGPTIQNLNLIVNQTWQELQSNYEIDIVTKDLRKLAQKLDAIEDQIANLRDAAVIEKAAKEMSKGEGPKALRLLSGVSKTVIAASKEIGTNIATELIMKMTGLK